MKIKYSLQNFEKNIYFFEDPDRRTDRQTYRHD